MIGATFGDRNRVRLFSWQGIPVFAHVSLPLGLLIVSRLSFAPQAWLGFVVVVVAHELGHAFLLRRYRLPVLGIVLHMAGGECHTTTNISSWESAIVAWGGIAAQLLLFCFMATLTTLGAWSQAFVDSTFYYTLTAMNLGLAGLNLLPIAPLDGREAWRLPWLCVLRLRLYWLGRKQARMRKKAARDHLRLLH